MHLARMKHPGPGTGETWVTDGRGDPMLVVIAEPSASLAAQLKDLLPDLRAVYGEGTTPVLCFDRGGWSPDLFADIIAAGFGLLTYRKNQVGKDIPDLGDAAFTVMTWTGDDGRDREYDRRQAHRDRQQPPGDRAHAPAPHRPRAIPPDHRSPPHSCRLGLDIGASARWPV